MGSLKKDGTPRKKPGPVAKPKLPAAPVGRPSALTRDIFAKIITFIKAGQYQYTAAGVHGITRETLFNWVKRGRHSKRGIYREFFHALQEAVAEGEARKLQVITRSANGFPVEKTKEVYVADPDGDLKLKEKVVEKTVRQEWAAAAWMLERMHPDRYGRRDKVEHTGDGGGPIDVNIRREDAAKVAASIMAPHEIIDVEVEEMPVGVDVNGSVKNGKG